MTDQRKFAPATARNREPIYRVLKDHFPTGPGLVLEISAGSGEHGVFMAPKVPHLQWQPTDIDESALASIQAWRNAEAIENLLEPQPLDVLDDIWPVQEADVIININMIHIAPYECVEGLMKGAGRILKPGGLLYMYGPYKIDGEHTAPSNEAFDQSLRGRNPAWGVRDLGDVIAEAKKAGIEYIECIPMPANNFSVLYRKL